MLNNYEYVRLSLELHLFFDRIMKEHSFFLLAGFVDRDAEYKRIASDFQKSFAEILDRVVDLSNGNISNDILTSQEIVTNSTLENENKTSQLIGVDLNQNITRKEMQLRSGMTPDNPQLVREIGEINQRTLILVNNLIEFKADVLNQVLECKMFTANYPLLIAHIMNEAKMYHSLLSKIQNREQMSANYLREQEIFWDNIMKEHAQFIRGLLDPSEDNLILTADRFANEYGQILSAYRLSNIDLTEVSLQETLSFKKFKQAGEDGILSCKIKSIIIPLLADHVLREANHFIRILRSYDNLSRDDYQ